MPFTLSVPTTAGAELKFELAEGEVLFVVGANGSGKSSLLHRFSMLQHGKSRRISAHRQTWFSQHFASLSPDHKRQLDEQVRGHDIQPYSRWKDDYSSQRPGMAIYDLLDAENVRARHIAAAVTNGDLKLAAAKAQKNSPLAVINELLRLAGVPISLTVEQNEQVLASRRQGPPYSVVELSDGERNALLLAAEVLTVPPGTLVLVDEPERHLHRSIISPLLTLLFARRPDCAFVVSTHEIMLPLDNGSAKTLLVRDCTYSEQVAQRPLSAVTWDADLLDSASGIDEALKRDILGARRRVLFVEGNATTSLDAPLYSLAGC